MNELVADTHSILWYLYDPSKLSPAADNALSTAERNGVIYISTVSLVELDYLTNKPKFPYPSALSDITSLILDPTVPIKALPLTMDVAQALGRVPRAEVPDMPDRIIAATAVAHLFPIVSIDAEIRSSASLRALVSVIW